MENCEKVYLLNIGNLECATRLNRQYGSLRSFTGNHQYKGLKGVWQTVRVCHSLSWEDHAQCTYQPPINRPAKSKNSCLFKAI